LLTEALQNGNYDSLVDSRLCNVYDYDEMKRMIACAAACLRQSPKDRPLMSKVQLEWNDKQKCFIFNLKNCYLISCPIQLLKNIYLKKNCKEYFSN
jgi:hypothetical protein